AARHTTRARAGRAPGVVDGGAARCGIATEQHRSAGDRQRTALLALATERDKRRRDPRRVVAPAWRARMPGRDRRLRWLAGLRCGVRAKCGSSVFVRR